MTRNIGKHGPIEETLESEALNLLRGPDQDAPPREHQYEGAGSRCGSCGMTLNAPVHSVPSRITSALRVLREAADDLERGTLPDSIIDQLVPYAQTVAKWEGHGDSLLVLERELDL